MKFGKEFSKNIIKIFTGNITAQVLNIGSMLLLTKILGVSDFGGYSVFLAYSTIISSICVLTYEKSIPNQRSFQIFDYICALFFISATYAILACVFLLIIDYEYSIYVALYVLSLSVNKILCMLSIRYKKFKFINYLKVFPAVFFFSSIALNEVIEWIDLNNAIVFYVAANIISLLFGFPVLKELGNYKRNISVYRMLRLLRLEKGFLIWVAPSEIMNRLAYYFPTLIIDKIFGVASAGQYSLTLRVCFSPISLITNAVGQVFQSHLAQENREGKGKQGLLTKSFIIKIVLLSSIITFSFYFIVPSIVRIIFGSEWDEAIVYIKILSPLFGLMAVVTPLTTAFHVYRKNVEVIVQQAIFLLISLFSFSVSWYLNSLDIGVVIFSVLSSLRYVYLLYVLRKFL
ncbi:oligosaccharide flippase family protein [Vibrio rotiferianus]|uniref:oligosaccharide flippase family protein n=1 Tax=Vibrio rotiferianus TaxID=190895 RepID=UPI00148D0EA7|nr:oligosaccharide flippase family protein [Vibrio rotiferianus]